MRREDWLWLVLKAAGLWLVVTAIEVMSLASWSWFDYGESDTAGREQLLRVAVPLAAGLGLLLIDFARWLPLVPPEAAPQSERVSTMPRSDWVWVGLKVVGAYYGMMMVVYAGQIVTLVSGGVSEWGLRMIGPAVCLALSLWLLLGDRVWRVATRDSVTGDSVTGDSLTGESVTGESVTRDPGRKLRQARDVFIVVMVFVALGSLPILLLWWVDWSNG